MAIHAFAYCPRLFYLEEVEEIRIADERVFEGRELHHQLESSENSEIHTFTLESETWGLKGKLDACRCAKGNWYVIEHKKGRSRKGDHGAEAWDSDRLQVTAYAVLLSEHFETQVTEARIRYHADNKTVQLNIGYQEQQELKSAIKTIEILRESATRPQITPHAKRCIHCSLAPVCLPEEERFKVREDWEPLRLYPKHHDRLTLHVVGHGTQLTKSGDRLVVKPLKDSEESYPIEQVEQVVLHGNAQATTQAIHLCFSRDVQIHWLGTGGRYLGGSAPGRGGVQRRIRQYEALSNPAFCLERAKELVHAKLRMQLAFLLRATRGKNRDVQFQNNLNELRTCLQAIPQSKNIEYLRGVEGQGTQVYFESLDQLILADLPPELHFYGRNRKPPKDAVNALLSFGYQLLYRDIVSAILAVGLEPSFGVMHTARSAAYPLALDIMELFRVPLIDISVIASLNRRQWNLDEHFNKLGVGIYLNDEGRNQAISLFEARKTETWKHPVLGYSLSYHRLMELEARLLEKTWMGHPGLFAIWSLR
jgi:CRISPR-associated protein Cas1